jgi:hypothetical protein
MRSGDLSFLMCVNWFSARAAKVLNMGSVVR